MKKIFAILIVAILALSVFSACNKKEEKITVNVDSLYSGESGAVVDGVKTFKTINEAVTFLTSEAYSDDVIKTVNLAAGEYKEKVYFPKELKNVKLFGATDGVTKISYGDFAGKLDENGNKLTTDYTATVTVYGDGFEAHNVWFDNCFDYFNPPKGVNDKQALAMYCRADMVIFDQCTFTGYQDTLETVSGRQYYYKCKVKGCVDFIFGNNPSSLFEECDIVTVSRNNSNGGYITAMKGNNGTNGEGIADYGIVFLNSKFITEGTVVDGSVAIGRPWRANATVAVINCELGAHISKVACGYGLSRYTTMSGGGITNEPRNARYFEYGNTGAGAISEVLYGQYFDFSIKKPIVSETPDFNFLTEEQASKYTKENIFAKQNGAVTYEKEWNPVI